VKVFCSAMATWLLATGWAISADNDQMSAILAFIEDAGAADGAPPAFAVVVIHDGETAIITQGNVGTAEAPTPVTAHTPFYIASITKSYIGLLATVLDENGVLPLEMSLASALPSQTWPTGIDPEAVSLSDLLSHSSGLNNPALNFRLSNLSTVDDPTFSRILESGTVQTETGFNYVNFGYQLYGYILAQRTGRTWQDWLDAEIFRPLGLDETTTYLPRLAASESIWGYQLGPDGWIAITPKSDETLHAAGGIYTTPADAATWLNANLTMNQLTSGAYERQRQLASTVDMSMPGRRCDGYAMGLMICSVGGVPIRGHFGTYAGWRSIMSFSNELQSGVYILAASDHMAQMWAMVVETQIYGLLSDAPGSADMGARLISMFEAEAQGFLMQRSQSRATAMARIGEFDTSELDVELQSIEGTYTHDEIGSVTVTAINDVLLMRAGVYTATLHPVGNNEFVAFDEGVTPEAIFIDENVLRWGDDAFRRQNR